MAADERKVDAQGPKGPGGDDDARAPWWRDRARLKRIGAGAGIAVSVLAIAAMAAGAVVLIGPQLGHRGGSPVSEPSRTSTASSGATSTVTTASPGATGSAVPTAPSPAPSGVTRVTLVPYRFAGAIWVCDGSGGDAQRIVASAAGEFALSPDGTTLAVVDAVSRTLTLVDVASRRQTDAGPAELEPPAWSQDSSVVAYTVLPDGQHDTVVRVVGRDGGGARTLGIGAMPCFAPDGDVVAVSGVRGSGVPLVVFAGRASRLIGRGIVANAAGAGTATVAYCDAGSPVRGIAPTLGTIGLDGTHQRTLLRRPSTSAGAFFGEARVTLDGTRLVYTESGDDGYSHIFALPIGGGRPVLLSGRGDGYPVCFSADGSELFYIDGNAIQGESTRLAAVRLDGTHRRVVIDGAGT